MNGTKSLWIVVIVVAIIASISVGYAWGAKSSGGSILGSGDYATGYAAGMNAAKKKLVDAGLIPPTPASITIISGVVKSVDADRFVINAGKVSPNPLDPQGPTDRTIMVTADTKITAHIPMTIEENTAAMKAFQDSLKAGKPIAPPAPYTEKTVTLSDLKIGMNVTVTAAADIRTSAAITATAITFDAIPSAAPMIPAVPVPTPTKK